MPRAKKTESGVEKAKTDKVAEEVKIKETDKKPEKSKTSAKKDSENKKTKLEEVKEKAKELEKKIKVKEKVKVEDVKEERIKSKLKARRFRDTLFPLDDYVKYSAHLGTKAVTPEMRRFVYRRRADGIAVLNTKDIDERLKEAAEFLKDFSPEDIFLACKREAGWKAAEKFSEVTGIRVFTKKYPAGIITNTNLNDFFEVELVIICDPWMDKNALNDALRVKKPIIGLCDTNNLTKGITKIIPCNNKAEKSLGLILFLLAREYLKARDKKIAEKLKLEEFTGKIGEEKGAKEGV